MKRCFFILVIMMFTCLSIYAEESNEETSMIVYVEDKEGNVIKDTMFGIYNDEGKFVCQWKKVIRRENCIFMNLKKENLPFD